jgi:hypothetical protein
MKRILIITTIFLSLTVMTIFAQGTDMSFYTAEFNRSDASIFDHLDILESVQNANLTGIGEFYHNALSVFLERLPNAVTRDERAAAEASARIIIRGLAEERYTDAAPDIWRVVQNFDVVRDINDGLVMQEALIALGQVGAKDFVPHIALRLDNFNTDVTSDVQTRRRIQHGVMGAINALEALQELQGFSPVFFASIGWYEPAVRTMASIALPNIVEDPGEIIAEIIQNASNDPRIKYEAWREMLRTRAPDSSKASVAAVALETGWTFPTSNLDLQRFLREMRISAIDTIRIMGVADETVYPNLERSYRNSFVTANPDFEEIRRTVNALSASGSDEAVGLLTDFLSELHTRRRSGVWGSRERQVMQMVIPAIGASRTQSQEARQLLSTILRSTEYTSAEQTWARDALRALGE